MINVPHSHTQTSTLQRFVLFVTNYSLPAPIIASQCMEKNCFTAMKVHSECASGESKHEMKQKKRKEKIVQ